VSVPLQGISASSLADKTLSGQSTSFMSNQQSTTIVESNQSAVEVSQPARKITGMVVDENGQALIGVNVSVKGTTAGTITNFEGKFSIEVPEGAKVTFSYIGYMTMTLNPTPNMRVVLKEDAQMLDDVVVTALGIKREKKALGYAVQDIKAERLTQAGDANLVNSLAGKIAGVQVGLASGGVGAATRIDIRGASSLSDNNEPLWVVDGVPFDNGNDNDAGEWGGRSRAGGAFDLNPDDIESISVLKGANAAALYGERGGNGVIVVTTKKGSRSSNIGVRYSGSVVFSDVAYTLDKQTRYGQGSAGTYSSTSPLAWGEEMKGQNVISWTGEQGKYSPHVDRLKDFCRTGIEQSHNLSVSGGNEKGSFRVSLGHSRTEGIFEKNSVKKTNFDLRADYDINKWLNIDTKVSYFSTIGYNRPELGNYGVMNYFNEMPANIRLEDLAPGYNIVAGNHVEKLYTTVNADYRNPYFLQEQAINNDHKDRTFGYLAANFSILPGLKAKLKYGLDYYAYRAIDGSRFSDKIYENDRPNYNTHQRNFKEQNYEFLISYNGKINEDFDFNINYGGSTVKRQSFTLNGTSGKLASEDTFFLGAGSNIKSTEEIEESETRSMYAFGQIAYRNRIYLDVTARNDWSSTLTSKDNDFDNSYFYPSVSLSGIVSEIFELPEWITFAKVRGSWAKVGKATNPYQTSQSYTLSTDNFNLISGNIPDTQVVKHLKPELSTSYELGLDLKLFNNRLGLDFTYYVERTKNQILPVETVQSSGFRYRLINAGLIQNKGIEVMLTTVPVKTKDFRLGVDFNFAMNEGMLEELEDKNDPKALKSFKFDGLGNVWATEGEKLGQIHGYKYQRDDQGRIIVGSDGLPLRSSSSDEVIGNLQADWTGSVGINAEYKNFYMNALVSIRQGGEVISISESMATSAGTAARTDMNNRMAFFVDGVKANGQPNDVITSAQEYFGHISGITEEFVYDASYAKLKEIAVGYNFPKSLLSSLTHNAIKSLRVSLVGRNLFYFYKNTPGTAPDAGAMASGYSAQAYDWSPLPATRSYGFSLSVGF
jgi:TonB-linked SusC/RagA family outer membrane protein